MLQWCFIQLKDERTTVDKTPNGSFIKIFIQHHLWCLNYEQIMYFLRMHLCNFYNGNDETYVNVKVIYYAQKKSDINDGINFINGQQIKQINFILNSVLTAHFNWSFFAKKHPTTNVHCVSISSFKILCIFLILILIYVISHWQWKTANKRRTKNFCWIILISQLIKWKITRHFHQRHQEANNNKKNDGSTKNKNKHQQYYFLCYLIIIIFNDNFVLFILCVCVFVCLFVRWDN